MRLLLDTHTFIWWDTQPARLSPRARLLCTSRENQLVVSVATLWEMQIKLQLGKLQLSLSLEEIIRHQQQTNGIEVLSVSVPHVLALGHLPTVHRDPFDRILAAQAKAEGMTIVSADPILRQYPVTVEW
ncbi:MAG: type II toxin-antitoxin system VapC family toxin [Actinomycetota bacterium]